MGSCNTIEVTHNERRDALRYQPEELMLKPPPLPVLITHIHAGREPGAAHLLQDDHNNLLLVAMTNMDPHRALPPITKIPSDRPLDSIA